MRFKALSASLLMFFMLFGASSGAIGPLEPSSSATWLDYASGRLDGTRPVRKFARNSDIDLAASEDVWSAGGNMTYLTSASAVEIVGDSANDDAAGTHCRRVMIVGLNENWDEAQEQVSTNGLSASTATTTTFIRVYRAYCDLVGAYGNTNDGNLTVRVESAGSTQAYIAAGDGQTQGSHWTVPRNYTGYGLGVHLNVASGKTGSVVFYYRTNADDATTPNAWRVAASYTGLSGNADYTYWGMVPFPEKTDIRAVGSAAANDTDITLDYIVMLIRNQR
jgi:hypothetical protein